MKILKHLVDKIEQMKGIFYQLINCKFYQMLKFYYNFQQEIIMKYETKNHNSLLRLTFFFK